MTCDAGPLSTAVCAAGDGTAVPGACADGDGDVTTAERTHAWRLALDPPRQQWSPSGDGSRRGLDQRPRRAHPRGGSQEHCSAHHCFFIPPAPAAHSRSETQPCSQLSRSWTSRKCTRRRQDTPEVGRGDVRVGVAVVDPIEGIEGVHADVEPHGLAQAEALGHRQVDGPVSRTSDQARIRVAWPQRGRGDRRAGTAANWLRSRTAGCRDNRRAPDRHR